MSRRKTLESKGKDIEIKRNGIEVTLRAGGELFKQIEIPGESQWQNKEGTSVIGVHIDTFDGLISMVHIGGPAPDLDDFLLALVSDSDVRRQILYYQESKTKSCTSKIFFDKSSSGAREYKVREVRKFPHYFVKCKVKHLLHVSMYNKLNKGFNNLSIENLVELIDVRGILDDIDTDEKNLKTLSKVKYRFPNTIFELYDEFIEEEDETKSEWHYLYSKEIIKLI